jgi:hypothetical protein
MYETKIKISGKYELVVLVEDAVVFAVILFG